MDPHPTRKMRRSSWSRTVTFLAIGKSTADYGAGVAAEVAWDGYVLHEAPNADSWDAITSLVRRRAPKALELSLDIDTARAERNAKKSRLGSRAAGA